MQTGQLELRPEDLNTNEGAVEVAAAHDKSFISSSDLAGLAGLTAPDTKLRSASLRGPLCCFRP